MNYPTISFDALWHVGSLDPTQKGRSSYEGAGLSVSEHPKEWAEIARLGNETWEATRPGNEFLDFYAMNADEREAMIAWGVEHGYVELRDTYRVCYWDDEYEEDRCFEFEDRVEAEEEAEDLDAEVEVVPASPVATRRLLDRARVERGIAGDLDLLATVFAEDALGLDGVHWDEVLDVLRLSAPRAVIVPSRIADWTFTRIE